MYKLDTKHILTYLLLGLGFATVMAFMYMQYVYYDAMIETLQITNAQLGFLATILGIVTVLTTVPGGVVTDHMDCRKALTYSLAAMMVGVAVLALFPTYQLAMVIWAVDGIVMSIWYTAIYKVVRVIAPPEAVGKSFGMFGIGVAIGSIIVNVLGLQLYDHFAEVSLQTGLSSILWAFVAAGMLSAIVGHILVMSFEPAQPVKEEGPMKSAGEVWAEFVAALKSTSCWLYVLACFCIYSFQVSISYFTPYFTGVLGTTLVFSGFVAIFRQYGLRIISSPIGGMLGDKIGGTSKVIRISMAILAVIVLIVMNLPQGTPVAVFVVIVFALGLLGTMNISLQASISEDCLVPLDNMGMAVGMTGLLTADLFQDTLFGSWLDKYGNAGYNYMFIYMLAVLIAGIIILTVIINRKKRVLAERAAAEQAE